MEFKKTLLTAALLATSAIANATVVLPGSETSLQEIVNGLTVGGVSSIDVNANQANPDQVWSSTDSGISPVRFVAEIAGNASVNTFGIYDIYSNATVELFNGSDTTGDKIVFEILTDGTVELNLVDTGIDFTSSLFGFYLGTPNGTFYSQESKNGDVDQMVAFQGGHGDYINLPGAAGNKAWTQGGWLLAFEDTAYDSSDKDFNDFVAFIESASPVSEPGSLALLGLGLAGLGFARRKQNKA